MLDESSLRLEAIDSNESKPLLIDSTYFEKIVLPEIISGEVRGFEKLYYSYLNQNPYAVSIVDADLISKATLPQGLELVSRFAGLVLDIHPPRIYTSVEDDRLVYTFSSLCNHFQIEHRELLEPNGCFIRRSTANITMRDAFSQLVGVPKLRKLDALDWTASSNLDTTLLWLDPVIQANVKTTIAYKRLQDPLYRRGFFY